MVAGCAVARRGPKPTVLIGNLAAAPEAHQAWVQNGGGRVTTVEALRRLARVDGVPLAATDTDRTSKGTVRDEVEAIEVGAEGRGVGRSGDEAAGGSYPRFRVAVEGVELTPQDQ